MHFQVTQKGKDFLNQAASDPAFAMGTTVEGELARRLCLLTFWVESDTFDYAPEDMKETHVDPLTLRMLVHQGYLARTPVAEACDVAFDHCVARFMHRIGGKDNVE